MLEMSAKRALKDDFASLILTSSSCLRNADSRKGVMCPFYVPIHKEKKKKKKKKEAIGIEPCH